MYAKDTGIPMSVVVNEAADPQTLDNLAADVLTRRGQTDSLRLYILGYIARGKGSFCVSLSDMGNTVTKMRGLLVCQTCGIHHQR